MSADLTADLLINGIALAATLFAILALPGGAGSPVERRLRALLVGLALLLALRMVNWLAPSPLLAIPVTLVAAWLPLLALRLVEHLLRRHASALLKRVALAGALALAAAALLTGALFPAGLMTALALYQAAMLAWIVGFILRARAAGLAVSETRQADTFALILLLAIPFAISDFRGTLPGLPVRLGGLGVLLFVATAARLAAGSGAPRGVIADLAAVATAGGLVAAGAWLLLPTIAAPDLWRLAALAATTAAAMLIVQRVREVRRSARHRPSLLPTLAALPDGPGLDALLAAHPLTASGRIVEPADLDLYDEVAVAALARHRVVGGAAPLEPTADAAARNLCAEHAATHLVRLSRTPPRFLALNAGALGGGRIEHELDLLARLAEGSRP